MRLFLACAAALLLCLEGAFGAYNPALLGTLAGGFEGAVSTQSGTTYTLAAADCGTTIEFTSASAITVTLPNSLSPGCHIAVEQNGAGQITFSAASGATLQSAHSFTKTFGQYAIVGLSVLSNSGGSAAVWTLSGDGA